VPSEVISEESNSICAGYTAQSYRKTPLLQLRTH
jgi:hypothetical protein